MDRPPARVPTLPGPDRRTHARRHPRSHAAPQDHDAARAQPDRQTDRGRARSQSILQAAKIVPRYRAGKRPGAAHPGGQGGHQFRRNPRLQGFQRILREGVPPRVVRSSGGLANARRGPAVCVLRAQIHHDAIDAERSSRNRLGGSETDQRRDAGGHGQGRLPGNAPGILQISAHRPALLFQKRRGIARRLPGADAAHRSAIGENFPHPAAHPVRRRTDPGQDRARHDHGLLPRAGGGWFARRHLFCEPLPAGDAPQMGENGR